MEYAGLKPEAIQRVRSLERRGKITPHRVLEDAENEDSPLHPYFEWDDQEAAYQHRLDTARRIIQSVEVIITSETVIRSVAYVRDPEAAPDEQGYIAVTSLVGEADLALRAVRREVERIQQAAERARGPARILDREDLLDAMLAELLGHLQKLSRAA